jgi:anti-anti-sigma factor
MNQDRTEIILDLKGLAFLDSEALELLVYMHKELGNRTGKLKIVGLNATCRDILTITRLINVFYVYENIHDAVKS